VVYDPIVVVEASFGRGGKVSVPLPLPPWRQCRTGKESSPYHKKMCDVIEMM